jgi:hypothetical protein
MTRSYSTAIGPQCGSQAQGRKSSVQEYDLYINTKKPRIGLYVRKGAGLPDFANPNEWTFDGTAAQDLLPASVVNGVEANGHAFRDMD